MRKSLSGVGLLVVLALTGCVGIPTSGGVQEGPQIDDQLSPEFVALPSDPRPGSSQEEILADFMLAARSPQGGYAVARQFLSSDEAEEWLPDATTLIRPDGNSPVISIVEENRLAYTVTSTAKVDQNGLYAEEQPSVTTTLTFDFVQEDGEWRISDAPDGIVLAQNSFNAGFREQAVYFFDPSFSYLVPDVRWFPARLTSPNRLVQALLAGPAQPLQQGVVTTAFPEATDLGESFVDQRADSFIVDLSAEALAASAVERDRMRQQLAATLGSPNVVITVRDAELETPDLTADAAVINPPVDGPALVGIADDFGFDVGSGISPIAGLTPPLVAVGATGATLSSDKLSVAFLGVNGNAYVARAGQSAASVIDERGGLVVPSIDPFRYVWSAQAASAASLTIFELDGTAREFQSGLPTDASVVSLDVSRDGTRLLLSLQTPVGPRLVIAGIVRQDDVPIKLGDIVDLPLSASGLGDATWVNDRSVAALTTTGDVTSVTSFAIGGPSVELGTVNDATTIAGGNNGVDGLRVIRTSGEVWRLQGSAWVNTGIVASFLATKQ